MRRALLAWVFVLLMVPLGVQANGLTDNIEDQNKTCGDWEIWCDISNWTADVVRDAVELLTDLVAWVFDQLLSLFVFILSLLPPLDFAAIDWSMLEPLFWFLDRMQFDVALGILGGGLTFRLVRKLLTIGQW